MSLSNSVSIQRVWMVNVSSGSAGAKAGSATTFAVERRDGGHALDDELVQRAAGALERLLAGAAGDDELGDHRVERAGDGVALEQAGVPAHARAPGDAHRRDGAGRGQEAAAGILAVDPELDGVRVRLGVGVVERLAVGDAELLAHQVDAGDLLGDRVLDLEAGVDLEEGDVAVRADEELAGAGADVAGLAQDRLGRPEQLGVLLVGEERRRGLLDELLVAALQRAVAGGDDDDVAVLVGEALGLDVARVVEVALDEALAAAERRDGLAHGGLEQLGDLLEGAGDLQAAAAAAEGRLDGDGQAVLLREGDDLVGRRRPGRRCRAPAGRSAASAMCRALTLSPRLSIASGPGPIQTRPASMTVWAKSAFSARKP